MPYKVAYAQWVANEAGRWRGILLMQRPPFQAWPDARLQELLAEHGFHYQTPDYTAIRDRLVADGLLELLP